MGFQNGMVIMVWRSLAGSLSYPDGYSYGLKEKRFGTPFTIDVADFVPKIFKGTSMYYLSRFLGFFDPPTPPCHQT